MKKRALLWPAAWCAAALAWAATGARTAGAQERIGAAAVPSTRSAAEFFEQLKRSMASGGGNGGNPLGAEFTAMARYALDHLERTRAVSRRDAERFRAAIVDTRVFFVDFLLCEEAADSSCSQSRFPARNYRRSGTGLGYDLILVHGPEWASRNRHGKLTLAAHEYLGLIGLETGTYHLSSLVPAPIDRQNVQESFEAGQLPMLTDILGPGREQGLGNWWDCEVHPQYDPQRRGSYPQPFTIRRLFRFERRDGIILEDRSPNYLRNRSGRGDCLKATRYHLGEKAFLSESYENYCIEYGRRGSYSMDARDEHLELELRIAPGGRLVGRETLLDLPGTPRTATRYLICGPSR